MRKYAQLCFFLFTLFFIVQTLTELSQNHKVKLKAMQHYMSIKRHINSVCVCLCVCFFFVHTNELPKHKTTAAALHKMHSKS